jgi:tetratricopeptide (TPR) repeat protein
MEQFSAGDPKEAVDSLRSALFYAPANQDAQFRMAVALEAEGHDDEAKANLRSLWQDFPESGRYNLELARIYSRERNVPLALQYFHGAIYGEWPPESEMGVQAQIQLAQFLIGSNLKARAQSELVLLSGKLPPRSDLLLQSAVLAEQAQDDALALSLFQRAFAADRRNPAAAFGAGMAAYRLDLYLTAARYLQRAAALAPSDAQTNTTLRTIHQTLQMSPYERSLPGLERARRGVHIFQLVGQRLQRCEAADQTSSANPQSLSKQNSPQQVQAEDLHQEWQQLRRKVSITSLRSDPSLLAPIMDLAQQVENLASPACGQPSPNDLSIAKIAARREELEH